MRGAIACLTALFAVLLLPDAAAQTVPLPPERPVPRAGQDEPATPPIPVAPPPVERRQEEPPAADAEEAPAGIGPRAVEPGPQPVQTGPPFDLAAAKACEAELAGRRVRFRVLDPIDAENGCGAERPLQIDSFAEVELSAPITVRCEMARALDDWLTRTVAPAAQLHLEAELTGLAAGTSYQCRRRNNSATGKLSEHAFANALDLAGFSFAERPPVAIVARNGSPDPERAFQAAARGAACAYFTTVLGPGTNAAHDSHLHVDLAFRSGGYRICQ
jgi:hypothetical protein